MGDNCKGVWRTLGEMKMFCILIGVVILCAFVKTHQPVHLQQVNFIICELCLSKVDLKRKIKPVFPPPKYNHHCHFGVFMLPGHVHVRVHTHTYTVLYSLPSGFFPLSITYENLPMSVPSILHQHFYGSRIHHYVSVT